MGRLFHLVREYNFSNASDLQIAAAKDINKQVRHKIEARETERQKEMATGVGDNSKNKLM